MGCGCDNICSKCLAGKFIVGGVILIAVTKLWPGNEWFVIGILLVLKGILKIAMPNGCGHCSVPMATAKKGKK